MLSFTGKISTPRTPGNIKETTKTIGYFLLAWRHHFRGYILYILSFTSTPNTTRQRIVCLHRLRVPSAYFAAGRHTAAARGILPGFLGQRRVLLGGIRTSSSEGLSPITGGLQSSGFFAHWCGQNTKQVNSKFAAAKKRPQILSRGKSPSIRIDRDLKTD